MAPNEITTELVFNQPPTSGRFLIPDSGQAACSQLTNCVQQCFYNGQTGNHTYLSCRNLILEEYENFNIELQRSRGVAIAILGRRCLKGRLLLRSSMRLIGLVDQLSIHMTGWGSQGRESEETIMDRSTYLAFGCFSFSSTSV